MTEVIVAAADDKCPICQKGVMYRLKTMYYAVHCEGGHDWAMCKNHPEIKVVLDDKGRLAFPLCAPCMRGIKTKRRESRRKSISKLRQDVEDICERMRNLEENMDDDDDESV